jgi:alpha-beta hydrolase superfamily lysophospholipase
VNVVASNPVTREEGRVESADGLALYWRAEVPARPRAALLFVHGLAEHSGRYRATLAHCSGRGYAAYAFDQRAHGLSPGAKVHVNRFDDFLLDLAALHQMVRRRHPGLPLFAIGHSHGGLVLLRYVLRDAADLAGVIVTSPLLGIHPRTRPAAWLARVARVLSALLPSLRLSNNVDPRGICRDPTVVEAYRSDPLVSRRVSARWFTSLLEALEQVHADAARLPVPTLVMAAGDDRIVDFQATRSWVSRAPSEKVEFVPWPGLYHELFNEPEKGQVLERLEWWLERGVPR